MLRSVALKLFRHSNNNASSKVDKVLHTLRVRQNWQAAADFVLVLALLRSMDNELPPLESGKNRDKLA